MNTTIAQQIANEGGVEAYLHAQQHKSLLRFLTCGSVDDGKSTLIGRLLHDTRQIYEDQLSSLHNDSKRRFELLVVSVSHQHHLHQLLEDMAEIALTDVFLDQFQKRDPPML